MSAVLSQGQVAAFRELVANAAAGPERMAELFEELVCQGDPLEGSALVHSAMLELLRRRLIGKPDREYIRLVAELRNRYADSWAEQIMSRPAEMVIMAVLRDEGTERFDLLGDETKHATAHALVMMLIEDAGLEATGADELVEKARGIAEQVLALPELEARLAQQKQG